MSDKPESCGNCKAHEGTACALHPGVYLESAAACPDFDEKNKTAIVVLSNDDAGDH